MMEQAYLDEKNVIASTGAWILLLEIVQSNYSTLRYTNNNEKVNWNGNIYQPVPIFVEDISTSISGAFPNFRIQIDDIDMSTGDTLRNRIKETDGLIGGTLRLMVVHSAHLSLTIAAIDESAEIIECELNAGSVILTLGISSTLTKRFPTSRNVPGFCRHKFRDALCKYGGTDITCDHTLIGCGNKNNLLNYGGSPGIVGGVYG